MSFAIEERRGIAAGVDFVQVADDKVIGSAHWLDSQGRERDAFHVLTVREGKIVDMQGCRSRREAEHFARQR